MTLSRRRTRRIGLAVVLILLTAYALAFIHRTSFVIAGERWYCLFDDAMISLRYAANWAAGDGLVWNPGERVEGYTSPLWTAVLTLFQLVEVPERLTCLPVQLFGIPILWACLAATARLAKLARLSTRATLIALLLLAAYYPLNFFTLLGMETGLLTLIVTLGAAASVAALRRRTVSWAAVLWWAPAVLTRPDAIALVGVWAAFLLVLCPARRLRLAAGGAIFAALVGAHLLWRHDYYGNWMPNTYYLKLTGWPLGDRVSAGLTYSLRTAASLGAPLLIASVMTARRPTRRHMPLLAASVAMLLYQIWVGGDAWPLDRYMCPTVPGLFVLAAEGIDRAIGAGRQVWQGFLGKRGWAGLGAAAALILLVNLTNVDQWLLRSKPHTTAMNEYSVNNALAIRGISEEHATIGVGSAGALPFFAQRRCVDFFGKCEPHIARMTVIPGERRPGHNKMDIDYVVRTYRPDVVAFRTGGDEGEMRLRRSYRPVGFYLVETQFAFPVRHDTRLVKEGTILSWAEYREFISWGGLAARNER